MELDFIYPNAAVIDSFITSPNLPVAFIIPLPEERFTSILSRSPPT